MKTLLISLALLTTLLCAASAQQAVQREVAAKPVVSWVGAHSKILQRGFHRIRTTEAWETLWHQHTGEGVRFKDATYAYPPRIDFARFEIIAFFRGPAINHDGEEVVSIDDSGPSLLIRFDSITYQTASFDGKGDPGVKAEPYGLWLIDRTAKPIVIEENVQGLIGQPPKWKEQQRFEAMAK